MRKTYNISYLIMAVLILIVIGLSSCYTAKPGPSYPSGATLKVVDVDKRETIRGFRHILLKDDNSLDTIYLGQKLIKDSCYKVL
jgi:hypothetical protein